MTERHDLEDLVAAYALDALEPDESRIVERALERDPELQRQLDEYRSVAAVLAESVETTPSTPSAAVWEHIQAAAGGQERDRAVLDLAPALELRRQRWFTRAATVVSIAAIALAVALSAQVLRLSGADPTEEAIEALVDDPSSEVVTLTGAAGVEASVVLGADGVGYMYADSLPALAADRTYQLWAILDEGETAVISAGVLGADPEQSPFQVVGNVTGFAITEEVSGGVVSSENEAVAVWVRDA